MSNFTDEDLRILALDYSTELFKSPLFMRDTTVPNVIAVADAFVNYLKNGIPVKENEQTQG